MILSKAITYEDFVAPDKNGSASRCPRKDELTFIIQVGRGAVGAHIATAICDSCVATQPSQTKPTCIQLDGPCVMARKPVGATVTEETVTNGVRKEILSINPFELRVTEDRQQ